MTEANEATVPSKKKLPLSSPSSAETRLESQDDSLCVAPPTASSPSALKKPPPGAIWRFPLAFEEEEWRDDDENEYPSNSCAAAHRDRRHRHFELLLADPPSQRQHSAHDLENLLRRCRYSLETGYRIGWRM